MYYLVVSRVLVVSWWTMHITISVVENREIKFDHNVRVEQPPCDAGWDVARTTSNARRAARDRIFLSSNILI